MSEDRHTQPMMSLHYQFTRYEGIEIKILNAAGARPNLYWEIDRLMVDFYQRYFQGSADDGDSSWDLEQDRAHNDANEITDLSGSWLDPAHDLAGNMTLAARPGDETSADEGPVLVYDAWNRLTKVYVDADNPLKQFIWGRRYVDSPVVRFHDGNTDGTIDDTVYYTTDANFNVTAVVDTSGAVVECYAYDPYGQVMVLNGADGTDPDVDGETAFEWDPDANGFACNLYGGCCFGRYRSNPNSYCPVGKW